MLGIHVTPARARALADHLDRLYRAAWALCGSREDAEDLVRDLHACPHKRAASVARGPAPLTCPTVLRTYISSSARGGRRPAGVAARGLRGLPAAPAAMTPTQAVAAREVFSAIAALPDDRRDVIAAVDVAGLSYSGDRRRARGPGGHGHTGSPPPPRP